MPQQPLIALDIGSTKVACAVGVPYESMPGFELCGTSVVSYPLSSNGSTADLTLVGRTLEKALSSACSTWSEVSHAHVALSHPALRSEQVQASIVLSDEPITIRKQDLTRLTDNALNQVLGVDRDPLLVEALGYEGNGFQEVRDPSGLLATRLLGNFHIITMPVSVRRVMMQAVESMGLEVAELTYTLPAAFSGFSQDWLDHQQILVMDVGGIATDIGLFCEGRLHKAEVLHWGASKIAERIARECRVTLSQAMSWSLEGMSSPKPEVRALMQEEWRKLEHVFRPFIRGKALPDRVLICGRGALMDGFAEWIEEATTIPASMAASPKTHEIEKLSRRWGLNAAIGLLESATQSPMSRSGSRTQHPFLRLIDHTKALLTEYF